MASVTGISAVQKAIQNRQRSKAQALAAGLKKAGLYLQAQSMKIVPVDKGNLKSSAFTRADGFLWTPGDPEAIAQVLPQFNKSSSNSIEVTVGYTASYALFVHENLDALHGAAFNAAYAEKIAAAAQARKHHQKANFHSRGPNQQAKFLETPFREKRETIVGIIKAETEAA